MSLNCWRLSEVQLKGKFLFLCADGHKDSFLSVTAINTSVGYWRKYPKYLWQTTVAEETDQERRKEDNTLVTNSVSHN